MLKKLLIFFAVFLLSQGATIFNDVEEEKALEFLARHNSSAENVYYTTTEAQWAYGSNVTDYNQRKMIEENLKLSEFMKEKRTEALTFDREVLSDDTVRQLEKIIYIGQSALSDDKVEEYNQLLADMETVYSKGEVCDHPYYPEMCLNLEPDLTRIMANSRNYTELLYAWKGWRDVTGPYMRDDYEAFVELANEAAVLNDQPDMGAYWRSWYEVDDLKGDVLALWEQMQPLYFNLHAFVRRRLSEVYGTDMVSLTEAIPAHLLGNMWAQSWGNLVDICEPFPGKQQVDVTDSLVAQGYNATTMFELSDEFFTSLGLIEMPSKFWEDSIITKPDDGRDLVCHASAWDFYNRRDFRIKQCTDITHDDFVTIHHEMGHVEYFLQYANQPVIYREGANPGFHEAVGDVLALSVNTPKHLKEVGLLDEVTDDPEADLNFLMSVALDKIAFLPFGLLMDLWRWDVFSGKISSDEYNDGWWNYRTNLQGIAPPIDRTENDFDPGAKYHIPANVPYIRYFVSFVVQFQFHKALCETAGEYDPKNPDANPLYKCDIYQSKEAGKFLADMLMLGGSQPWPESMERLTGQRNMDASALIEYFQPLTDWLQKENSQNGDQIGWETDDLFPTQAAIHSTVSRATNSLRLSLLAVLASICMALLLK